MSEPTRFSDFAHWTCGRCGREQKQCECGPDTRAIEILEDFDDCRLRPNSFTPLPEPERSVAMAQALMEGNWMSQELLRDFYDVEGLQKELTKHGFKLKRDLEFGRYTAVPYTDE